MHDSARLATGTVAYCTVANNPSRPRSFELVPRFWSHRAKSHNGALLASNPLTRSDPGPHSLEVMALNGSR